MHRQIIMSHNLVTEVKKMFTRRKIGTPITFRGDKSSVIGKCAGSVPMTNESLQFVYLNPIPVW